MAQPSNRDALVEGAIHCLKTKGYANTTARDIAAASDANLASIGYHFGSKDALLNEALIRILEQRNRHVGRIAVASGDGSPLGFLSAMFESAMRVFNAPRPLFVAFIEGIAQAERSPALRQQMAAHYREGREGIADALEANVGGGDPDTMASLLLAIFDGLLVQRLLDTETTPSAKQLLAALVDLATPALSEGGARGERGDRSRSTTATSHERPATRPNSRRAPTSTRETSG